MEILKDKLQQEIRKTLQSVVYYGYDIISAELDLLKAFDKYAQLQSLPKDMPTDEEIEKEFPVYHQNNLMTVVNGHRQEGAKWMRSQLQSLPKEPTPLREESIKLLEWIRTFEVLELKQGFWILESQISSEDLYSAYINSKSTVTTKDLRDIDEARDAYYNRKKLFER